MNRITEITKRDILDLFQNGLEIDEFFQTRTVTYNYYGRLEEIIFLKDYMIWRECQVLIQDFQMQNRIFGNIQ